jgi:hypothetical protein
MCSFADGIQLSEAITGDGADSFVMRAGRDLEGIVSKRIGFTVREWPDKGVLKIKNPDLSGADLQ